MNLKNIKFLSLWVAAITALYSPTSHSLSNGDFNKICNASPVPCDEHPILQAYVGGALDLVATLDEKTDRLQPIYCKPTGELFDVSAMIWFMLETDRHNADDNAMVSLITYLKEKGGCSDD